LAPIRFFLRIAFVKTFMAKSSPVSVCLTSFTCTRDALPQVKASLRAPKRSAQHSC